jgi:hypothetical protein
VVVLRGGRFLMSEVPLYIAHPHVQHSTPMSNPQPPSPTGSPYFQPCRHHAQSSSPIPNPQALYPTLKPYAQPSSPMPKPQVLCPTLKSYVQPETLDPKLQSAKQAGSRSVQRLAALEFAYNTAASARCTPCLCSRV